MEVQIRDNVASAITDANTDEQVIALWLRSKSELTRMTYAYDANLFRQFTGKSLHATRLEDLISFQESLTDAETTNYRRMCVIKSLFTFAHEIGYLPFNIGKAVKIRAPKDTLSERIISHEAVHELIDSAESMRDNLMTHLFYKTGMRSSELQKLKWLDLNGGVLTVQGKGSRTRNVRLPEDLLDDLRYFRGDAKPEDAMFTTGNGEHMHRTTIWRIIKRALHKTRIEKDVSTHWLRHAHVSHALDKGAPVHLVAATVGHASLTTTTRYAHARPDVSSGDYL